MTETTDGYLEGLRKTIQDLNYSDSAKVNATLDAFNLDLYRDEKESDKIQAAGGCFALINLLKKCLDKAIDRIPACDQVTNLHDHAELTTLQKTLSVIIRLTFQHDESRVGICTIGGVEAIVKIMKTLPKCQCLARRVSTTNASATTAASLQVDTPVATANAATVNIASTATENEKLI
jgi:hypothetical protein